MCERGKKRRALVGVEKEGKKGGGPLLGRVRDLAERLTGLKVELTSQLKTRGEKGNNKCEVEGGEQGDRPTIGRVTDPRVHELGFQKGT